MKKLLSVPMLAVLIAAPALAQSAPESIRPTVVVNTPAQPVPVTGTVRLDGGVGAITGAVRSADKTVVIFEGTIPVNSVVNANHVTPLADVSDYRDVRVAVSNGSCGPCSDVRATVFAGSATGSTFELDSFVLQPSPTFGNVGSRVYGVPGQRLLVALNTVQPGGANFVRVLIVGRAN